MELTLSTQHWPIGIVNDNELSFDWVRTSHVTLTCLMGPGLSDEVYKEWSNERFSVAIFCIRRENVLVREPTMRRKLVKFVYLKFLNDLIIWIRRELNVSPRASSWRTIRYFDVFRGEREAVPYIKVDNGQVGDWKGCCWYISFHLLALVHQISCDFSIQFKMN